MIKQICITEKEMDLIKRLVHMYKERLDLDGETRMMKLIERWDMANEQMKFKRGGGK